MLLKNTIAEIEKPVRLFLFRLAPTSISLQAIPGMQFFPSPFSSTEAYLYYLRESNLILPEEDEKAMISRFRMARFLNETPLYNKDRRGLNIPILIFQILFLILTKRYDETIDRIEAIEKYTTRYLKKDDNFRSNCFVKMLLRYVVQLFAVELTIHGWLI